MAYPESITYEQWDQLPLLEDRKSKYHIGNFAADGFVKVCDVETETALVYNKDLNIHEQQPQWYYKNIKTDTMFLDHRSWIYFIVVNDYVVKIGETGNPLGIAENTPYKNGEVQPKSGTTSRFGRIRKGDMTDANIRSKLETVVKLGLVSLWAKQCDISVQQTIVGGIVANVVNSSHKSVELAYLDYFINHGGNLPILNKAKK